MRERTDTHSRPRRREGGGGGGGVSRPVRRRCRSRYLSQPSSRSSQSQQHAARWFLWPLRSTYSQQQRGSSIAARRPPSAAAAAAGPGTRPSRQRRRGSRPAPPPPPAAGASRPPPPPPQRPRPLRRSPAAIGRPRLERLPKAEVCGGGVCVCACVRGDTPPAPLTHSPRAHPPDGGMAQCLPGGGGTGRDAAVPGLKGQRNRWRPRGPAAPGSPGWGEGPSQPRLPSADEGSRSDQLCRCPGLDTRGWESFPTRQSPRACLNAARGGFGPRTRLFGT